MRQSLLGEDYFENFQETIDMYQLKMNYADKYFDIR